MVNVNGVDYPADPNNPGWVLGWAVFRPSPWHFVGLVPMRGNAVNQAKEMGNGYEAAFGSHKLGTDDFIISDSAGER